MKDIILNLGKTNPQPGSVAHKVWTIYSQAMDTARRNAEGATPILADLKKIETTPHEGMTDLFLWKTSPTPTSTPCMFQAVAWGSVTATTI